MVPTSARSLWVEMTRAVKKCDTNQIPHDDRLRAKDKHEGTSYKFSVRADGEVIIEDRVGSNINYE